MHTKQQLLIIVCGAVLSITSCNSKENGGELYPLFIGETRLSIELAVSDEQRQQGLMYRENLPENQGMLFVFEKDDYYGFWMKNTFIPLSIAFVDSNLRIRSIHDMQPLSERIIRSAYPVRYALEVNQGFFSEQNIETGDRLQWSPELSEAIGPIK